jgi:hypothetical protein
MDMREKIARAYAPTAWAALDKGLGKPGDHHDSYRDWSLAQADRALDAMREPTDEMVRAASGFFVSVLQIPHIWQAMIAAAAAQVGRHPEGEG